jgi:hypothetical protein
MPHIKTGRKHICGGAEVITSGKVSERMKGIVTKILKDRYKQEKRKQPRKRR